MKRIKGKKKAQEKTTGDDGADDQVVDDDDAARTPAAALLLPPPPPVGASSTPDCFISSRTSVVKKLTLNIYSLIEQLRLYVLDSYLVFTI